MGYEVFLSFRGPDARTGITSYLFDRLCSNGIDTFRDDEEIRKGREIWPEIRGAIHGSKISVLIFSKDYASSRWCLDEVAEIVDRARSGAQQMITLPIFYQITPAQVKRQTGSYAVAFNKHEEEFDRETVQRWREALKFCARLDGYESNKIANGDEAELVRRVVAAIKRELKKSYLHVPEVLIEDADNMEEVLSLLDCDSDLEDRRMVALIGLDGIGKTTLAKIVYNQLCDLFGACASLMDVEEVSKREGILFLQNQLISQLNKERVIIRTVDEGINFVRGNFSEENVLILLDDITDESQLDYLAGRPEYFGPGSRIIVTTAEPKVLKGRTKYIHEVTRMPDDLALQLFSKHAFGLDHPRDQFVNISINIVRRTGGLPLAIEVTGSSLSEEEKGVWEEKLAELRGVPDDKVLKKLLISYDRLTPDQKQIFLDVACFFMGEDIHVAFCMWDDLRPNNPFGPVEALLRKSFVKIEDDDKIYMHPQLRNMGREIVLRENLLQPERTSRLWRCGDPGEYGEPEWDEAHGVLKICLVSPQRVLSVTGSDLKRFPYLRCLDMKRATFSGSFRDCLMDLKCIRWKDAPPSFTVTDFNPKNLVILDLSHSEINEGWVGWKHFKGAADSLKVLNLSYCQEMTRTPDLSIFPRLERLILVDCTSLLDIHPSIGHLSKLVSLNLEHNLGPIKLPQELSQLKNLRELILHGSIVVPKVPVSAYFLQRIGFLSAPCCASSTTRMASESGLRVDISWFRHFQLNNFPISMRRLQTIRQASPSYKQWLKRNPEKATDDDATNMEELCQLQESGNYIPENPSPLRPPCRIAILEDQFLYFYCKSHPVPRAIWWGVDAFFGVFFRLPMRVARLFGY